MTNALQSRSQQFWSKEVEKNQLAYADTQVVRFLGTQRKDKSRNHGKAALEVGCGSGRNLMVLDDYGFSTHGVDFSAQAIQESQSLAKRLGRNITLHHCDFSQFAKTTKERFDVVLFDLLYLLSTEKFIYNLALARQCFNDHGVGWISLRHPDSWFSSYGKPIDEHSLILDERAIGYEGSVYAFYDTDTASSILRDSGFRITNIERVELWKKNMTQRHVWLHFWVSPE